MPPPARGSLESSFRAEPDQIAFWCVEFALPHPLPHPLCGPAQRIEPDSEVRSVLAPGEHSVPVSSASVSSTPVSSTPVLWAPLDPAPRRIATHRGFSGAVVLQVRCRDRSGVATDWALRCTPSAKEDPVRTRSRAELLQCSFAAGVSQVAVPVRTVTGEWALQDGAWSIRCEPWKPGQSDYAQRPTLARLTAAMETLARWHQVVRTHPPTADWQPRTDRSPSLIARRDLLAGWNDHRLAAVEQSLRSQPAGPLPDVAIPIVQKVSRVRDRLWPDLVAAAAQTFPLQACWGDLWHDHLLFEGDRLTGLIDAEAARVDSPLIDLARLLSSLHPDEPAAWSTALDVYTHSRALSAGERQALPVFDRSGALLSALTWLERLSRRAVSDDLQDRVTGRLSRLGERFERWLGES